MADIAAIRAGLKTNLATVGGLQSYANIPDSVTAPCALVLPDEPFIDREAMQKGLFEIKFRVLVLASKGMTEQGQTTLDGYLATSGSGSVWTAIESDKTLGGAVSDCAVQQITTYGDVMWNELPYWGAELKVAVLAAG